jgi:guanine nucleotide-binding protein subunit alpha
MAPAIMCFGKKSGQPESKKRNDEIEKILRNDKKRQDREVKLLLLGKSAVMYEIF